MTCTTEHLGHYGNSSTPVMEAAKQFAAVHWAQPRKIRAFRRIDDTTLDSMFKIVDGTNDYKIRYCDQHGAYFVERMPAEGVQS